MAAHRMDRICEEVKKELSHIIPELKDPRLKQGLVSVIRVDVTRDLRFAKAYISVLGDETASSDAIQGLQSAAGFIRKEIGHRLNLRLVPEFTFVADHSIEHGAHINQILHDILPDDTNRQSTKKEDETNE